MSATVKYKGEVIASLSGEETRRLTTGGKYCEADISVENLPDDTGRMIEFNEVTEFISTYTSKVGVGNLAYDLFGANNCGALIAAEDIDAEPYALLEMVGTSGTAWTASGGYYKRYSSESLYQTGASVSSNVSVYPQFGKRYLLYKGF